MQLCTAYGILSTFLNIYFFVMLAYALVSWFPSLRRYRATDYLAMLVEPVLAPVRRVIPPIAGLDLSFLLVLLLLQWVNRSLVLPYTCGVY
jgi:YggT family protein